MYELGEVRESMAKGCMKYVEDFVNNMTHIQEPFWVVYHASVDRLNPNRINQTVKAYHRKPPEDLLGILVWYVDNSKGIFQFREELSNPPDIPLNGLILSDRKEDQFTQIMQKGQKINVLAS